MSTTVQNEIRDTVEPWVNSSVVKVQGKDPVNLSLILQITQCNNLPIIKSLDQYRYPFLSPKKFQSNDYDCYNFLL